MRIFLLQIYQVKKTNRNVGDSNSAGGLIGGIAGVLHQFQLIFLKDGEEKVDEILRGFFKLPWGQLWKWNIQFCFAKIYISCLLRSKKICR